MGFFFGVRGFKLSWFFWVGVGSAGGRAGLGLGSRLGGDIIVRCRHDLKTMSQSEYY